MYEHDSKPSRLERRMVRRERRAARWGIGPVSPGQSSEAYATSDVAPINPEGGLPQNNYEAYRASRQSEGLARLRVYLLTSSLTLLLICVLLTAIWFFSGAGYFWPGWIIAFWVFAMVVQLSNYYIRRSVG